MNPLPIEPDREKLSQANDKLYLSTCSILWTPLDMQYLMLEIQVPGGVSPFSVSLFRQPSCLHRSLAIQTRMDEELADPRRMRTLAIYNEDYWRQPLAQQSQPPTGHRAGAVCRRSNGTSRADVRCL